MLFAYPVSSTQSNYASVFSDIRNDDSYSEFYKYYKDKGEGLPIPPPLSEEFELRQSIGLEDLRKSSMEAEPDVRSSAVSTVMHGVVDSLVQEDESESPPHGPFRYFEEQEPACSLFPKDAMGLGDVCRLARDQMGCRLLQKRLEEGAPLLAQYIFSEVLPQLPELMMDTFGNYLVQKLLEVLSLHQLRQICETVSSHLPRISLDVHGTRAVQRLVDIAATQGLAYLLIAGLRNSVVELAKDQNGNHVIQRCLLAFSPEERDFIFDIVSLRLVEVATHRQGCCVLQRCIDAAREEKKTYLIDRVLEHLVVLVQDAFGNYVVQYILDLGLEDVNLRIAQVFTTRLLELSRQKFSSNVVEKCLQQAQPIARDLLLREMCSQRMLAPMLQDQFANYGKDQAVVQRALTLATGDIREQLLRVGTI